MDSIEKDFQSLIKNEALGQAYIFYGGSLKAELEFAKSLANYLESGNWIPAPQPRLTGESRREGRDDSGQGRPLSDSLLIDGTQQNLGVDVARTFSDFLYRQPVASKYRTLIVNAAGELTTQAQNAILKIAEEPPSHGLIILTVRNLNTLLPALRSRFQAVHYSPKPPAGGLGEYELSPAEVEARKLVDKFLLSNDRGRAEIIKNMVKSEREIEEKSEKVIDHFVTYLIAELHKKPEQNWRALKHLLHRFTIMNDFQTNKRLQLEAVLQFLK